MSDLVIARLLLAKDRLRAAKSREQEVAEAKRALDRCLIVLLLCIIGLIGIAAYQLDGIRTRGGITHFDRVQLDRLISDVQ